MQTTISSKGQVTVPKAVRDALNLRPGDHVAFLLDADGAAHFVPVTKPLRSLKGMVPKPRRALTLDEMDAAIAKGASGR